MHVRLLQSTVLFCLPIPGYYFNTDVDLKPKKNEDGSVDYRELNVISYIKEGDLLAKLFPEDRGIKGYDVQGREIKPKQVRSLQLEYGNNIRNDG